MNIKKSPLRIIQVISLALVASLFLSACGGNRTKPSHAIKPNNNHSSLVGVNYEATEGLLSSLKKELDPGKPIIVASFVNVDNLSESSTFGRISAEQFASKLSQSGYIINELKLRRESLYIKERAGEFMLSRELKDIASRHTAQAILVGIYGLADNLVYVSVKMVDPDGLVIASSDYSLMMSAGLRSMFNEK